MAKEDKLKDMAGQLYLFLFSTCKNVINILFELQKYCIKSRYLVHSVGNLWGRLRNGRGWGKLNDASFAFFCYCRNVHISNALAMHLLNIGNSCHRALGLKIQAPSTLCNH